MTRYRPPQSPSSPYITPAGRARLETELRHLGETLRPEVVRALAAAAAEGDRSENAEYQYRKKQLREIDRRLRYLVKRLEVIKTVDKSPEDTSRVFFGARVTLEDDDGELHDYRIVGPDEIDVENGDISIDAPLARALLKKQVDDDVSFQSPKGVVHYVVIAIVYGREN
jgi:transcription elongation factor GreB